MYIGWFYSFLFIIVKKDECFFVSSGPCQCSVHQQPRAEWCRHWLKRTRRLVMWVRPEYNKKWRTEQADFCKGITLHPSGGPGLGSFQDGGNQKAVGRGPFLRNWKPGEAHLSRVSLRGGEIWYFGGDSTIESIYLTHMRHTLLFRS